MTRTPTAPSGQLEIVPPSMHPGQMEVIHDPSRGKILRAGRRWRKSGLGVVQAFTGYAGPDGRDYLGALHGGQIGWWVPSMTARYLVADWEPIKNFARQIPGHRIEEANHRVLMPGGGWIMMLTGDTVDSGRGLGLDGAVIDEASLIDERLYVETIQSTVMDRLGWTLLLFTPKGLNWVYALEQEVRAGHRPNWRAFHFRSMDNPTLSAEALADVTRDMPTLVYRQEIDAEYVTGGAGVFHREWVRTWSPETNADGVVEAYRLGEERVAADDCWRFSTADLAWSVEERADFTVVSTWAVTPRRHLILLDVVRGHFEGPDIPRVMAGVVLTHRPSYVLVERAARQLAIIQAAVREGLPIREIRADRHPSSVGQGDVKVARALTATAMMESSRVWLPPSGRVAAISECVAELLAFPAGAHDDFVDTLSYAAMHVSTTSSGSGDGMMVL